MRTMEVVHITWIDSEAINTWTPIIELDSDFKEIHTIGMLVHHGHEMCVISSSYDPGLDSINAAICIPTKCIQKIETISVINLEE